MSIDGLRGAMSHLRKRLGTGPLRPRIVRPSAGSVRLRNGEAVTQPGRRLDSRTVRPDAQDAAQLQAGGRDRPTDATTTIEQLPLPEAGGKNVVNVTIVDFRGVDTMFEITVFGIAALCVANLVTASKRSVGYTGTTRFAKIGAESMIFDQVIRMIFHVTLLVSLYVAVVSAIICGIAIAAVRSHSGISIDIALVRGLLGFLTLSTIARYAGRRGL